MPPAPLHLSLVIPVYNEAGRIGPGLDGCLAYLDRQPFASELLVVDDGSRDETARLVEAWAMRDPRLRLLRHHPNRGKGFAVRQGMLQAQGAYCVFTDIDLSVPIQTLDLLLDRLGQGWDVVVGSRQVPGARVEVRQAAHREFMGRVYTRLANRILGLGATDYTCGFKGFRREAARDIFGRQRLAGWSFDAELRLLAERGGHRILEVPVTWRDDAATRVRLSRDVLGSFWELVRLRLHYPRGARR